MSSPPLQFDFGQNWLEFSLQAITSERIASADREFARLHADVPLKSHSFLEIGFGQGLSLLIAQQKGALVVGCDINPKCAEALAITRRHFPALPVEPTIVVGSILESAVISRLRTVSPSGDGLYDVVHSWGVLHHTGDMAKAFAHAAALVRPDGHLVVAIYNRHWSSRPWLLIKWLYVHSPGFLRRAMVGLLYPVIYAAKWLVTRRNPSQQQRGMDFFHNVVDWVGGYPYEYASIGEMTALLAPLGFILIKAVPAEVPTGCNEFVFRLTGNAPAGKP